MYDYITGKYGFIAIFFKECKRKSVVTREASGLFVVYGSISATYFADIVDLQIKPYRALKTKIILKIKDETKGGNFLPIVWGVTHL